MSALLDIVAVIGSGAMGAGIAQVAASAGHVVLMFDNQPGAAEKGRAGIVAALDRRAAKGGLEPAEAGAIAGRLKVADTLAGLADARLVIEAIVENAAIKRGLFAELETIVAADAILATNTSSLSITLLGQGLARPGRFAGFHFFNPAPLMKLVELVSGLATDPAVIDRLSGLAAAWGKIPVRARSTPGFIVNRVARPFYAEAWRTLEEGGADAATIDALLRGCGGFRMGPFELMDLIGHDVNFAVTRSVFDAYFGDPHFRPSLTQQELVAAGWLGRKTGRGIFDHASDAGAPEPDWSPVDAAPASVTVAGDLGPAESLVSACERAGIAVERTAGEGLIRIPGATLALTDGRTAQQRAQADGIANLVLFDLSLDYAKASAIAITGTEPDALAAAAALFAALGKNVAAVGDLPGMVVMRTIAMLANEAAEAVHTGVATSEDVDRAMLFGVNYPAGPFLMAQKAGPERLLAALEALQSAYGDDRYRASLQLRRMAMGTPFASVPPLDR